MAARAPSSRDAAVVDELCGHQTHLGRHHELLPLLAPQPGERFLEVGCGTGFSTGVFAELTRGEVAIVGVDASRVAVERARERADAAAPPGERSAISYRCMDARHLAFPDGSFDGAFCSRVLGHAMSAELVVAEMLRVVRRGGRVLCIEQASSFASGIDEALRSRVHGMANPTIGRAVARIMSQLGCREIVVTPHVQSVLSQPDVGAQRSSYAEGTGLHALAESRGRCTAEEVERYFQQLETASALGGLVECVVHLAVLGRKTA